MKNKPKTKIDLNAPEGWKRYENKVNALIRCKLREIWHWSKIRQEALKKARFYVSKGKRKVVGGLICQSCKRHLKLNNRDNPKEYKYSVDHIEPIGEWKDWNLVINSLLFCSVDNLQVLCKQCHDKKTAIENDIRSLI